MVEFSGEDKITEIQKILAQQKKKEAKISETIEELEKAKKESSSSTKKIEELLKDALSELDEETLKKAKEVLTKPVEVVEIEDAEETKETVDVQDKGGDVYKPQDSVMKETYETLEEVYRSVQNVSKNDAIVAQKNLYKNLAEIRSRLEQQKKATGYNEAENLEDVYKRSESEEIERISSLASNIAEIAGSDEMAYEERTQTILNEIKRDMKELAYKK